MDKIFSILEQEVKLSLRFFNLLEQEFCALSENRLDVLEEVLQEKRTLFSTLSELDNSREQEFAKLSSGNLLADLSPASSILWNELQQLAKNIAAKHDEIGILIATGVQRTSESLRILLNKPQASNYYTKGGYSSQDVAGRFSDLA